MAVSVFKIAKFEFALKNLPVNCTLNSAIDRKTKGEREGSRSRDQKKGKTYRERQSETDN